MIPLTIWQLLSASAAIKSLVGSAPVRVYENAAPQDVAAPYITWRAISQVPEVVLDDVPCTDRNRLSVYCWADTQAGARQLARAVRDVIQPLHVMTSATSLPRDTETQRFGFVLDFDVWERV